MSSGVTGINYAGETATLYFHPTSPYGDVTVSLHRDRGSGPMVYQHHADAWTITGGDPATIAAMVAWGEERARCPWLSSDAPGAVAFRAWVADVRRLRDSCAA